MGKIDLDAMNIDELANLRDRAIEKLAEKVAARQAELEAELQRLSQFGSKSDGDPIDVLAEPRTGRPSHSPDARLVRHQAPVRSRTSSAV